MSRFGCYDCGETFSEPDSCSECIGSFWGAPAYETFYKCPCCGSSDDIEELRTCPYADDEDNECDYLCEDVYCFAGDVDYCTSKRD